jgi:hypothetical protein
VDYTYSVAAFDKAGNISDQSEPVSIITGIPDTEPPTVPGNFTGTYLPATKSVYLNWDPSTDNVAVAGYYVYRNGVRFAISYDTQEYNYWLGSGTYSYTVAAFDKAGNISAQTEPVVITTTGVTDSTPPSIPTGLTGIFLPITRSVYLDWEPSTDDVEVAGYYVYRNGTRIATSYDTLEYNYWLALGTTYTYTVAAFDRAGNVSAQSDSVTVTTLVVTDTEPPSTPTGLTGTYFPISRSVFLTWQPSTDNVGVVGYRVYRNGIQLSTSYDTQEYNYWVATGITYTYTVAAYDRAGNSSVQSDPVTIYAGTVPTDVQSPTAPADLTAMLYSTNAVRLQWGPSEDDVGVSGYYIYRNGVRIAIAYRTWYYNFGLMPGVEYTYTVAAFDRALNISEMSNPVTITR